MNELFSHSQTMQGHRGGVAEGTGSRRLGGEGENSQSKYCLQLQSRANVLSFCSSTLLQ